MKKPLLYAVRHGSTNDSGKEIFRGQRDSALDKEGFLDAHKLKEFFEGKEWDRIFCSTMTRAIQTATIICDDQSDYQPETVPGLEPWAIGTKLTGAPKNAENKKLMAFYIDNPDETPEGGESRNDFEHRVWPILAEGIELGWRQGVPPIAVVHSSIIHSINHLLIGENHEDISVEPGGVIEIYFEDSEIRHRAILKKRIDDSSFQSNS
jgi:broad specificity phosphatase PhoE